MEKGVGYLAALALVGWNGVAWAQPGAAAPTGQQGAPNDASGQVAPAAPGANGGTQDKGVQESDEQKKTEKEKPLRWRGTTFTLDQSATTQTVGLGDDYLSYNPTYEMEFLFMPRYRLLDAGIHTLSASARIAASKELTNSDVTTQERELLFSNTLLNLTYTLRGDIAREAGVVTLLSLGARFTLPTSKASWMSGERFRLGAMAGVRQSFPITGVKHDWLPSGGLMGRIMYDRPLRTATTGENPDFKRTRQDAGGRTFISSQISTGAKVKHQLTAMAAAQVDVTQKLHLSSSYVWIMQWTYEFSDSQVQTALGPVTPKRLPDGQHYRVIPWFSASIDYDVMPEFGVSVGYYNATNQIGPDGQRRNPLWSPDARVFFDITANLDEIYRSASGKGSQSAEEKQEERRRARIRRMQFSSM